MSYTNLKFIAFFSSLVRPAPIEYKLNKDGKDYTVSYDTLQRFVDRLQEAKNENEKVQIELLLEKTEATEVKLSVQEVFEKLESISSSSSTLTPRQLAIVPLNFPHITYQECLNTLKRLSDDEEEGALKRYAINTFRENIKAALKKYIPDRASTGSDPVKEYKEDPDAFVLKNKNLANLRFPVILILLRHYTEKRLWDELTQFCINLTNEMPQEISEEGEKKKKAEYNNATTLMLLLLVLHNQTTDPKDKEEILRVIRKVLKVYKGATIESLELYNFLHGQLAQLYHNFPTAWEFMWQARLPATDLETEATGSGFDISNFHVIPFKFISNRGINKEWPMVESVDQSIQTIFQNEIPQNFREVLLLTFSYPYLTGTDPNAGLDGDAIQKTLQELTQAMQHSIVSEPNPETITDTWKLWAFIAIVFLCFIFLALASVGPFVPELELFALEPLLP